MDIDVDGCFQPPAHSMGERGKTGANFCPASSGHLRVDFCVGQVPPLVCLRREVRPLLGLPAAPGSCTPWGRGSGTLRKPAGNSYRICQSERRLHAEHARDKHAREHPFQAKQQIIIWQVSRRAVGLEHWDNAGLFRRTTIWVCVKKSRPTKLCRSFWSPFKGLQKHTPMMPTRRV